MGWFGWKPGRAEARPALARAGVLGAAAGCWPQSYDAQVRAGNLAKGQPAVNSYSYTASFAVALSARPILSVGRIWADGTLLRGAAGDSKAETGFRLHPGDEDQAVDPLIAAHEGTAAATAHRGIAYAVFEDLQLADFGNRIPSLTFEVTADAAPLRIDAIAREIGGAAITSEALTATLGGFSAYGDSARGVAAMLAQAAGGWFAPTPDGVELRAGTGLPVAVDDAGFGSEGQRRTRTVRPVETVPRVLTLAHYDPARDYQTGAQQVRRAGAGVRSERLELPAAIGASEARTLAAALLSRAEVERVRRTVALDAGAAAIAPGDRVTVAGEPGSWRVVEARLEGMVAMLTLVRSRPRRCRSPRRRAASSARPIARSGRRGSRRSSCRTSTTRC